MYIIPDMMTGSSSPTAHPCLTHGSQVLFMNTLCVKNKKDSSMNGDQNYYHVQMNQKVDHIIFYYYSIYFTIDGMWSHISYTNKHLYNVYALY